MSAQTEDAVPRPVCFMVMPFRKKDTRAAAPAPSVVDFDALWDKAFFPALESLGYQPVRADQDLGALIIKEMLERLYFSDLVVADLTIPNGNVYYEIGIRHAAKGAGCVLTGADWSSPLFDVDQMRQVRYPLAEGAVTDETAAAIRQALIAAVPKLAEGASPMFQTLEGYPANVKPSREGVIRKNLDELSRFQAARREVALVPKGSRRTAAIALQQRYASKPPVLPAVALEVLLVMRDYADAGDTLAYIDGLPESLKRTPFVQEQRALVLSKAGDHRVALAALLELVESSGATSERMGLIGGRYKKMAAAEEDAAEKARLVSKAIDAYERGMQLDLNDFYSPSNLPRLYRQRARRGDDDRARTAAAVAMTACARSRAINPADEWVRPTLLGMAFDAGDVAAAEALADDVEAEGQARWKLDATIADLEVSVRLCQQTEAKAALAAVLDRLKAFV
ncbi:MAG TPA: tetratricopeptide repeat-containing protein [Vicinamibacterales bacterium]|nr:tetratricopeptide repeat-containing protein [Vicinamibacterales bacterium]